MIAYAPFVMYVCHTRETMCAYAVMVFDDYRNKWMFMVYTISISKVVQLYYYTPTPLSVGWSQLTVFSNRRHPAHPGQH